MPAKCRATRVLLSAAALVLVGTGTARSQAIPAKDRTLRLAAAEPALQYNFPYPCNQEHIVVGHCRHDSDEPGMPPTTPQDDFCQVYYPDRPKRGGFEAMGVELRGDLIKTLSACGAFGAPAAAPAGSPKAASSAAAQGTAPSQPAQPSAGSASNAQVRKQFCDQILQLRSLAPQGFRSIDLGPKKGEPEFHGTSIQLMDSHDDCFIDREAGKPPYYLCSWTVVDESGANYDEARISEVGNLLASCLNARPDWTTKNDVASLDINSAGVDFSLHVIAGELLLNVEAAQPGRPSAPAGKAATAPVPAPTPSSTAASQSGSKAEMRKQFCDQLLQLRALAPQGFRSIDLGPMKGESADMHSTALRLQGPDADCYITRKAGEQANYVCSWPMPPGVLHPDDPIGALAADSPAEAQFRGMGNLAAHCLGVRPDWSFMSETGVAQLDLESVNVHYELFVAGRWMNLSVEPAKH